MTKGIIKSRCPTVYSTVPPCDWVQLGCRVLQTQWKSSYMVISWNGNIFRVTGPLCREFTGHRWIPLTKASDAELWCFLLICTSKNDWANNRDTGDFRCYRTHYDVTVMGVLSMYRFGTCRINPLHAKFFRGIKNIYLHFMSFLYIDMAQIVEILPQVRQEHGYST